MLSALRYVLLYMTKKQNQEISTVLSNEQDAHIANIGRHVNTHGQSSQVSFQDKELQEEWLLREELVWEESCDRSSIPNTHSKTHTYMKNTK